jgi:hypothetical protein
MSRFTPLPRPSLDGRVPTGRVFRERWRELDRQERQWVRQATAEARRQAEPELQALVAGYAWRQLQLLAWAAGAFFLFGLFFELLGAFLGQPALTGFHIAAVALIILPVQARRLAVALANNIGPPRG